MRILSKKSSKFLSIVIIVIVVSQLPVLSNTVSVKKGNSQFDTIQEAINAADPGEAIKIMEGNYQENLKISKSLTLKGKGSKSVKIQANRNNLPALKIEGSGINVSIEGIKIVGSNGKKEDQSGDYNPCGLYVKGESQVKVSDLKVSNCKLGIALNETSKLTLKRSVIRGNSDIGIKLTKFSELFVQDSDILENGTGLKMSDNSRVTAQNVSIRSQNDTGILVGGYSRAVIRDSLIADNKNNGLWLDKYAEAEIRNSQILDNKNGFKLKGSPRVTLIDNKVNHNDVGISMRKFKGQLEGARNNFTDNDSNYLYYTQFSNFVLEPDISNRPEGSEAEKNPGKVDSIIEERLQKMGFGNGIISEIGSSKKLAGFFFNKELKYLEQLVTERGLLKIGEIIKKCSPGEEHNPSGSDEKVIYGKEQEGNQERIPYMFDKSSLFVIKDVNKTRINSGPNGINYIEVTLRDSDAKKLAELITDSKPSEDRIGIVLDGVVLSAPVVSQGAFHQAKMYGTFNQVTLNNRNSQRAKILSAVINGHFLPYPYNVVRTGRGKSNLEVTKLNGITSKEGVRLKFSLRTLTPSISETGESYKESLEGKKREYFYYKLQFKKRRALPLVKKAILNSDELQVGDFFGWKDTANSSEVHFLISYSKRNRDTKNNLLNVLGDKFNIVKRNRYPLTLTPQKESGIFTGPILVKKQPLQGELVSGNEDRKTDESKNTITVAKEGTRFNSIQSAINAAYRGDTILVKEGVYKENILIDKNIHLKGEGPSQVKIKGKKKGYPIIGISPSKKLRVQIEGLTLEKVKGSNCAKRADKFEHSICPFGISSLGDSFLKINDVRIKEVGTSGIAIMGEGEAVIRNSKILDSGAGVAVAGPKKVLVSELVIRGSDQGINLSQSANAAIKNSTLKENAKGIYLRQSAKATIKETKIKGDGQSGLKLQGNSKVAVKNSAVKGYYDGMLLQGSARANVRSCMMTGNDYGLRIGDKANLVLNETKIQDNSTGFSIAGSSRSEISKNIISNNETGISAEYKARLDLISNDILNNSTAVKISSPKSFQGLLRGYGNKMTQNNNRIEGASEKVLKQLKSSPNHIYLDNKEFNFLQEAIKAAKPGDTVRIEGGTYYSNLIINKELTLKGIGSSKVKIDGVKKGLPVIKIKASGADVTLKGLAIQGAEGSNTSKKDKVTHPAGLAIVGGSAVELTDASVTSNDIGIKVKNSSTVKLKRTEVEKNRVGIELKETSKINIEESNFLENSLAISLKDAASVGLRHSTLKENKIAIEVDSPDSFKGSLNGYDNLISNNQTNFQGVSRRVAWRLETKPGKIFIDGKRFYFLSQAIRAAEPEDTILIKSVNGKEKNTYYTNLKINKDLTLRGSVSSTINIVGRIKNYPIILTGPSNIDVTIENLTLKSAEGNSCKNRSNGICTSALTTTGQSSIKLINSEVSSEPFGVITTDSSKLQISDSIFITSVLLSLDSSIVDIDKSKFVHNEGSAISFEGQSTASIKVSEIKENSLGITLKDSSRLIINSSEILDNGQGLSLQDSARIKAINNSIENNGIGINVDISSKYTGTIEGYENELTENKKDFIHNTKFSILTFSVKGTEDISEEEENENMENLVSKLRNRLENSDLTRPVLIPLGNKKIMVRSFYSPDTNLASKYKELIKKINLPIDVELVKREIGKLETEATSLKKLEQTRKNAFRLDYLVPKYVKMENLGYSKIKPTEMERTLEGTFYTVRTKDRHFSLRELRNHILKTDNFSVEKFTGWINNAGKDSKVQFFVDRTPSNEASIKEINDYLRDKFDLGQGEITQKSTTLTPRAIKILNNFPKLLENKLTESSYVVSKDSTTFSSIQNAVNYADPGYIIEIKPGIYEENLLIQKNLTLSGEGISKVILDGVRKNYPVLHLGPQDVKVGVENLTIQDPEGSDCKNKKEGVCPVGISSLGKVNVELDSLNIIDSNYGVRAQDYSSVMIVNSEIVNNESGLNLLDSAQSTIKNSKVNRNTYNHVLVSDSAKLTASNSEFNHQGLDERERFGRGLLIRDSAIANISFCEISGNFSSGIIFYNSATGSIEASRVTNNSNGVGVSISVSARVSIEDSTIKKNWVGLSLEHSSKADIKYTEIGYNKFSGVTIKFDNIRNTELKANIDHCKITNNKKSGISLWSPKSGSPRVEIRNSLIKDNLKEGLKLDPRTGTVSVSKTKLSGSKVGIKLLGSEGNYRLEDNVIRENEIGLQIENPKEFKGEIAGSSNKIINKADFRGFTQSEEKKLVPVSNPLGDKSFGPDSLRKKKGKLQVSKVGTGFRSIQKAIDVAEPGATVNIREGIYYENLHVNKSLTIQSSPNENVVIKSEKDKYPAVLAGPKNVDVSINNVTLKGAKGQECIDRDEGLCPFGLFMVGGSKVEMNDAVIKSNWYGVGASDLSRVKIQSSSILSNEGGGIVLGGSARLKIRDIKLAKNNLGILVGGSANSNISRSKIIKNRLYGILLGVSAKSTVKDSSIIGNGTGIKIRSPDDFQGILQGSGNEVNKNEDNYSGVPKSIQKKLVSEDQSDK